MSSQLVSHGFHRLGLFLAGATFVVAGLVVAAEAKDFDLNRDRHCLATAIYFEAHGWPVSGQVAVGQVIMNRVRSPNYPETICEVVYEDQRSPNCQFPFACDGRSDIPQNDDQWALAQDIARKITAGELWLPEVGYAISLKDERVAVLAPKSPSRPEPPKEAGDVFTGTGFIINDHGDVVTIMSWMAVRQLVLD